MITLRKIIRATAIGVAAAVAIFFVTQVRSAEPVIPVPPWLVVAPDGKEYRATEITLDYASRRITWTEAPLFENGFE